MNCMQSRLESGSESDFYGSQFLVLPVARENGLVLFVMKFSVIWNTKLGQVYVVGLVCMGLVASNLGMSHETGEGTVMHSFGFFWLIAPVFCVLQGTYLEYIHRTNTYIACDISVCRMKLSFRSPLKDVTSAEYLTLFTCYLRQY